MRVENNYTEKRQNNFIEAIMLTLTIICIWSFTCYSKSIWPFGRMLLDIGDMAEECVPLYTYLWDVIHGEKSLFFDWNTGLGNNMAGPALYFGLISPFNIFFLFVKRAEIEATMSIYIMIKLVATGFSMRFLLKKWFTFPYGMRIPFCVLYVFSVFNMQYYYAPMWLDVSCMFPLVMYGYFLLMERGKEIPYIIFLAISAMMSFQHTYMLILMLLFLTGFLPMLFREKYKKRLLKLLIATLIAMMSAAWIWIPGGVQILQSERAEYNKSLIEIWNSVWIFFTAKWMKLLNLGIPLSLFLSYSARHLKDKGVRFFVYVIVVVCAPIILESTNLLWHGGSYQGYTMRYSYMVAFWILAAGAWAYERKWMTIKDGNRGTVAGWISIVNFLFLITVIGYQYLLFKDDVTVYKSEISSITVILIIFATILGGLGLLTASSRVYPKYVFGVAILQSIVLASTTIIVSGEKEDSYIAIGNEVAENESRENLNPAVRIKNMEVALNHNYPFIMKKNAASNYLGTNASKQIKGLRRMGYAQVGYRMSDYGGTLFSDALLGVNEVISRGQVNKNLYDFQNTYGDYNIYECLHGYKTGIKMQSVSKNGGEKVRDPFSYQNLITREMLGTELFDVIVSEGSENEIEVGEESILYLYADDEAEFEEITITDINSERICQFSLHKSGWMNGILELGTWENTSLNIHIAGKGIRGEVFYALLPMQKFIANEPDYFNNYTMREGKNSLEISLDGAEENDYLFLPFYNDRGWKCTVNGQRTEPEECAYFLMAVPLRAGTNKIRLTFMPEGLKAGICITAAGMVLLGIVCRWHSKKEWKKAGQILWIWDEIVFSTLIIVFYVIPAVFLILFMIK